MSRERPQSSSLASHPELRKIIHKSEFDPRESFEHKSVYPIDGECRRLVAVDHVEFFTLDRGEHFVLKQWRKLRFFTYSHLADGITNGSVPSIMEFHEFSSGRESVH